MLSVPMRLQPSFRERVWGATDLSPWFRPPGARIGEVWFLSEGEQLPILVKFLFTTEKLSVQVHPDDNYARRHENSPGKTEMWHVLRAGPDAAVALGLRERVSRERLREAALSGEIENLLRWVPVEAGDTVFVPAGAIHAVGAGLALCEIQQQSDITYRLYDYGRPRPLHLDRGVEVASLEPHPGKSIAGPPRGGARLLAECSHFRTDLLDVQTPLRYEPDPGRPHILVVLEGEGTIDGRAFRAGEAWLVAAGATPFFLKPAATSRLLRTYVPED